MNPTRQFLNVLLEHFTVNHAEKQTRLLVINGVVINISSIYKTAHSLAIKDGLVVVTRGTVPWSVSVEKTYNSGLTMNLDLRLSVTYNFSRYFMNCNGEFNNFRVRKSTTNGRLEKWVVNASFGVRL